MALTSVEEAQLRDLIAQQSALLSLASSEATIISKLGATKKNIGNLTAASTFDDTDLLVVRQGTTDKSIAGSVIKSSIVSPDATESVKGVIEVATQAEVNSGSAGVLAVTAAKLRLGFAISLATNGYIAFPSWMGGLIIQWGTTSTITTDTQTTVTFPIVFPNECLSALANYYVTGTFADHCQSFGVGNITDSNFTIQNQWVYTAASTSLPAKWIAIGY